MRIGALADTHVLEALPELPAEVPEALAGCELILHAGDITDGQVLERLGEIAPVIAVAGDHDRHAGLRLAGDHIIEVAGRRIGVTHGRRNRGLEILAALISTAGGELRTLGIEGHLSRRLGAPDLVVYGHLHVARVVERDGVLFVNPGGVYSLGSDAAHEFRGLKNWAYRRAMSRLPSQAYHSSVAVIELPEEGPIEVTLTPLTRPIRPAAT